MLCCIKLFKITPCLLVLLSVVLGSISRVQWFSPKANLIHALFLVVVSVVKKECTPHPSPPLPIIPKATLYFTTVSLKTLPLSLAYKNHPTTSCMKATHPCPHAPRSFSSTMSNSLCSRPAHRRQESGELDIFEAALYFAGGIDGVGLPGRIAHERVVREERRKSVDVPMSIILPRERQRVENYDSKEKKGKQPSSPGSRLASFLKSIFHQTASKKKSKSLNPTKSLKDGDVEDRHGGRNRRRSIGHSQSIRSSDSKSIFSSESSVSGTPAPHTNILTKAQSRSSKSNDQQRMAAFCPRGEVWDDKRVEGESWIAERAKSSDGLYGKRKVFEGGKPDVGWNEGLLLEKGWVLKGDKEGIFKKHGESEEVFRRKEKESREEDGGESDSSSDLFELKNYDFGELSSGLPVYGTTDMEIINRGASIHSAAF